MGKKQMSVDYDRSNLQGLANYMEGVRTPMKGGHLPRFRIDLDGLEKTIKSLPRKAREAIEKFWGLNPGTINHSHNKSSLGNIAYERMFSNSKEVLQNIFTLEYSIKYEPNVADLVTKMARKVNKGNLEMSDIEVVKYLNIFFIIFYGGPNMLFEDENNVNTEVDDNAVLDEYALLLEAWNELQDIIPDNSINLKLLLQAIEMLDFEDVLAMKKFAGIEISQEDLKMVGSIEEVKTLQEIRAFKERIFSYGCWWVTANLILNPAKVNLIKFMEYLDLFRQDWENIKLFKSGTKQIMTAEGTRNLQIYQIGELEFTDPYEVMLLYVARNLIFQEK